jgi:hypothetical protein
MPGRLRFPATVTSGFGPSPLRMPQNVAPLRWLSAAPSPHASTALIQRPRADGA